MVRFRITRFTKHKFSVESALRNQYRNWRLSPAELTAYEQTRTIHFFDSSLNSLTSFFAFLNRYMDSKDSYINVGQV